MSQSHAYSILGAYELKDNEGNVLHKIIQLRNPWAFDSYVGKWHDTDYRWESGRQIGVDFKSQVPFTTGDDGKFFMDIGTFKEHFLYFLV